MRASTSLLAFALILPSAACSRSPSSSVSPESSTIALALVDSVAYRTEMDDGILWRVQAAYGNRVDTVPVLTKQLPVIARSDMLYGFRYEQSMIADAFGYSLRDRTMTNIALPEEFIPFASPRFSPLGDYLAYAAQDSTGMGYPAVVTWPGRKPVFRGTGVKLLPTDTEIDHIRWLDETTFEIMLDIDLVGFVHRVTGSVKDPGHAVTDTVRIRETPAE